MPKFVEMDTLEHSYYEEFVKGDNEKLSPTELLGELLENHPQLLPEEPTGEHPDLISKEPRGIKSRKDYISRSVMYDRMHVKPLEGEHTSEAEDYAQQLESEEAKADLLDRIKKARSDKKEDVLVTKIPTVMFMWDIKDIKRLMLADPHVESSLSTLLRSDITYKLNSAAPSALGTRLCGVPTQARGDQDIRMCAVNN